MHWSDLAVSKIKSRCAKRIDAGEPIVIRDEKTASGRVHVGSLRGVAIHGIISEILDEQSVKNSFLYEINDFDPLDSVPVYLNKRDFEPHLGKPLCAVPSPNGHADDYAEYFASEFIEVIGGLGFYPEYYRLSELYRSGRMNKAIRLALENAGEIRGIYERISGSKREGNWLPLSVICEKCGKVGTTRAVSFNGAEAEYVCAKDTVEWASGCGNRGKISPFDGHAKLPWKVEWAAKFSVLDVNVEGAGKDHSTRGGAREVADAISREIFKREPPYNIPYEFFNIRGKKMASSKGLGMFSREAAELMPPDVLRFLLLHKEPSQVIDFSPDGSTIPDLFDLYDLYSEHFFAGAEDDYGRVFYLSSPPGARRRLKKKFNPRFSQVAFLTQMPHMELVEEAEKLKGSPLAEEDREELARRTQYARIWLERYAPEDYKFELKDSLPQEARQLSKAQKNVLSEVLKYVRSKERLEGQELHTKLHEIRKRSGLSPNEFFGALYLAFLDKDHGPKAGWFFSVLDKQFLEKRLAEAAGGLGKSIDMSLTSFVPDGKRE